jgi:endoglycosylceramidase
MNELHIEADYSRFASIGFNVVRLPVGWMWFEPQPGVFDQSYLDIINRDVQWAKEYGIYIILDMHQSRWAPKFLFPNGNQGCGSPDWTVTQYPATDLGMQAAMTNFWTNDTLQKHYIDVWRKLATAFVANPTIAGYDIMNEPRTFNGDNGSVKSFYLKVIQSIRSVDANHIIFLEPVNYDIGTVFAFSPGQQVVWSPHFYPLASQSHYFPENISVLREEFTMDYNEIVLEAKNPMWIGEYGAFMTDGSAVNWLQDAIRIFNQYNVGSAWWPYEGGPITEIPAPVVNQFNQ